MPGGEDKQVDTPVSLSCRKEWTASYTDYLYTSMQISLEFHYWTENRKRYLRGQTNPCEGAVRRDFEHKL